MREASHAFAKASAAGCSSGRSSGDFIGVSEVSGSGETVRDIPANDLAAIDGANVTALVRRVTVLALFDEFVPRFRVEVQTVLQNARIVVAVICGSHRSGCRNLGDGERNTRIPEKWQPIFRESFREGNWAIGKVPICQPRKFIFPGVKNRFFPFHFFNPPNTSFEK